VSPEQWWSGGWKRHVGCAGQPASLMVTVNRSGWFLMAVVFS
jgi:hypothetical protein